jgi:hypothetical protein
VIVRFHVCFTKHLSAFSALLKMIETEKFTLYFVFSRAFSVRRTAALRQTV